MIGTIGITALQVECIVGIYPHERANVQTVILDIELDSDFEPAATSDTIGDAVDYDQVTARTTELIQTGKFQLIETMAERVAAMLLDRLPAVSNVRLSIRKPAAVPAAAASFVRVERRRL